MNEIKIRHMLGCTALQATTASGVTGHIIVPGRYTTLRALDIAVAARLASGGKVIIAARHQ